MATGDKKVKILSSELFEESLKTILSQFAQEDFEATKKFKLYLDTIIINIPTKASKYKKSQYFDDENIKEIPHEEFKIIFYMDDSQENFLILDILQNETAS